MRFVGRSAPLRELVGRFQQIGETNRGLMLAVRGRRQVGKSTLYTEFLRRADAPHVFFSAIKHGSSAVQFDHFRRDALDALNPVPEAATLFASSPTSWTDVFGRIRLAAASAPLVVILDEFPWAAEADPTLEGELQNAWDRHLQHLPVLLILVGSDVTMMERLTSHDRPLFGRAREDVITAFNPAEVAAAIGTGTALDAFDAYLATGGYPKLIDEYARSGSLGAYVRAGFADENSDLVVVAQRTLDAEFPPEVQARRVLSAIGGHEVGHPTFSSAVGRLGESTTKTAETALIRALRILVDDKGLVAVETPVGAKPDSRLRRYRITDPYLRFWFRFVEPHLSDIARGRGDLAISRFEAGWSTWRGMAIEPVVHDALFRLAPSLPELATASTVGSWWNRDHRVEVDIVAGSPRAVAAIGTVKWRQKRPVTAAELQVLAQARAVIPGAAAAALLAVCPAGVHPQAHADLALDATQLLAAWEA